MYISRIQLDTDKRETMRALAAPGILHGCVESCFHAGREHPLWRIDMLHGNTYVLILSRDVPDLKPLEVQLGVPDTGITKDYGKLLDKVSAGSHWHFRLTANPTWSQKTGDNIRGKVHAHRTPEHQTAWLVRQGEKHGFMVDDKSFTITQSKPVMFRKGKDGGRPVTLLAVTYEGALTVTDVQLFQEVLQNGIGRGKAYGMGMLTVVSNG